MLIVESSDRQAILDAQKADEAAIGYPKLEGQYGGGGIHLVGPDPTQPEKLWTLHASDPLVTVDGKTFGYEPAAEVKVAPARCVIVEKSPAKWAGATPLAVAEAIPDEKEVGS